MLRHVSICVDLRLRPAMYVYAVVSVYVRLRLATRCRLRMSTCVDTVDTRRHTSSISNADLASILLFYWIGQLMAILPLFYLVSTKFSSSGFSHICLHRSKCVDIGLCRSTDVDRRPDVDQLCLHGIDTGRQTGLSTLRLQG